MIWVLTRTCLHSNHSLHNTCASTKETKTILSIRFPEYTLKKKKKDFHLTCFFFFWTFMPFDLFEKTFMKSMRQKSHIENKINVSRIFLLHLPKLQKCIALLISLTAGDSRGSFWSTGAPFWRQRKLLPSAFKYL